MASWSGISSLPLSRVGRCVGISVEASIGDIEDSCRVWKSYVEAGYDG